MSIVRTSQRRTSMIVVAREPVLFREIQAESTPGPEVGTEYGVIDNDLPPIQPPLFGAFRLVLGLLDDAPDVLDDLLRPGQPLLRVRCLPMLTERCLDRISHTQKHSC